MPDAAPIILLLDDDRPTRRTMCRWLSHLGFRGQVPEAEDGEQGLALVTTHCRATPLPASLLVLRDLGMLVMDGLEFLERYAQLPSTYQQAVMIVLSQGN